jgi:hypothetical protein
MNQKSLPSASGDHANLFLRSELFLVLLELSKISSRTSLCTPIPSSKLTQKDQPFIFGPEQIKVQEDLKATLLESPALCAIDYTLTASVILTIDTSYIAIAFYLCQCDIDNPSKYYYN